MVVKQIYSLIEYDEAVKTMEAGADNIGLVPMRMVAFRHIVCQSNACTAFSTNASVVASPPWPSC